MCTLCISQIIHPISSFAEWRSRVNIPAYDEKVT